MEWDKQPPQQPQATTAAAAAAAAEELNNGGMFVKVMTDEQMEVLRKQIAVYATICEQLVDLHKSLTSHHDLAGFLAALSLFLSAYHLYCVNVCKFVFMFDRNFVVCSLKLENNATF